MTYLFPDTNIFMHYRWIGEIDWCGEIASRDVTLIVAHSVVRELDRHKTRHLKKHLRSRAGDVVRRLRELYDPDGAPVAIRERTLLVLLSKKPAIEFEGCDLERTDPDDQLLAAIIDFRLANPDSSPMLVTADLGLQLRANHYGIAVGQPDERFRLPDELDPVEVENRELRRQLAVYREASPRLVLALQDQTPPFMLSAPSDDRLTDELRRKLVRRARERHPFMRVRSEMADDKVVGALDAIMRSQHMLGSAFGTYRYQPSDEQINSYNEKLKKYLQEYEASYLTRLADHRDLLASSICVALELRNEGSAPAQDVRIELVLPEDTAGLAELPSEPTSPEAPRQPGVRSLDRGFQDLIIPPFRSVYPTEPEPNVSGPLVLEGGADARRAVFHVHRLKHLSAEQLGELHVVFDAPEAVRNFKIEYRLVVGNMPKATVDTLNITVNRDKRPGASRKREPR